ncbi:hypothetical protein PG987_014062 [Apiospora arundinis]
MKVENRDCEGVFDARPVRIKFTVDPVKGEYGTNIRHLCSVHEFDPEAEAEGAGL